jgi:hypothetical protein
MCLNYDDMWQDYLGRLEKEGADRDAPMAKDAGHSCGH